MVILALIALAGLLAGAMNAVAGGGSFVTLPVLIAVGVPAVNANATSTVALVPSALASAFAYRHDFKSFDGVGLLPMVLVSIAGGALGAFLLMFTPKGLFAVLVPWLLLFGTITFAFGRKAGEILRERVAIHPNMMIVAQFILGIYGGYFGGAVGIMMLATWVVLTHASIASVQASRNLLNACMNATASAIFIAGGMIYWREMAVMLIGAMVGGYGAAHFARGLDQAKARIVISCLNAVITALVFWRTYG